MSFFAAVESMAGGAAGAEAAGGEATEVGIGEAGNEAFSTAKQDIGGGHQIQLNAEQIKALLHAPEVVEAIMERAKQIQDAANKRAITKGAHYGVTLQNRPDTTRARANIWTENYKAVIDNHYHGTLLKVAADFPSDARVPYTPPSGGDEEQSTSDAANVAAEGGEEGGSAAELASAAEIAAI